MAYRGALDLTDMESILYARLPEEIVVIRVSGKGNHQNSLALRRVVELTSEGDRCPQYVFDLEKCSTMDSTFMGVLASIGLRQHRVTGSKSAVVNVTAHVEELLNLLGLKYILDIRKPPDEGEAGLPESRRAFSAVEAPDLGKLDRIAMMIEAHERLIDVDGQNEARFRGVLQNLRDSLERHRTD